jgi:D-3-phosphoglycerate dehydrogenase
MGGQYSFNEALLERIKYLGLKREHISAAIERLKQEITPSFKKNQQLLKQFSNHIYIFSGGFEEVIIPIAAEFDIPPHQIYANRFIDAKDNDTVIHIDTHRLMTHGDGKSKQLIKLMSEDLHNNGSDVAYNVSAKATSVYVIGDGSTDAITKKTGFVTKFYLFAENIYRETVAKDADKIIYSLDEFIEDIRDDIDFLP